MHEHVDEVTESGMNVLGIDPAIPKSGQGTSSDLYFHMKSMIKSSKLTADCDKLYKTSMC